MAYKACLALITAGRTDGLVEKIDRLAETGCINEVQRGELLTRLAEKDEAV